MSEITENHKITDAGAGLVKAIMNTNPITGFVQTMYDEYAGILLDSKCHALLMNYERLLNREFDVSINSSLVFPLFISEKLSEEQKLAARSLQQKEYKAIKDIINTFNYFHYIHRLVFPLANSHFRPSFCRLLFL